MFALAQNFASVSTRLNIIQRIARNSRRGGRFGGLLGDVSGKIRGGFAYWSGRWGFGVNKQGLRRVYVYKCCRKHGFGFGEAAALLRLLVSLPRHSERSGAAGGLADTAGQLVEKTFHSVPRINRARARVVVTQRGAWVQLQLPLCQLDVDKSAGSKSKLFMTLA